MKNKIALLSLALVAFGTVSSINTKPALAGWGYKWWEHPVRTYNFGKMSQSDADKFCQNYVYNDINWRGGNFYDMEHKYWMVFVKFARPNVWAHRNNQHCVINASWGYVKY